MDLRYNSEKKDWLDEFYNQNGGETESVADVEYVKKFLLFYTSNKMYGFYISFSLGILITYN